SGGGLLSKSTLLSPVAFAHASLADSIGFSMTRGFNGSKVPSSPLDGGSSYHFRSCSGLDGGAGESPPFGAGLGALASPPALPASGGFVSALPSPVILLQTSLAVSIGCSTSSLGALRMFGFSGSNLSPWGSFVGAASCHLAPSPLGGTCRM